MYYLAGGPNGEPLKVDDAVVITVESPNGETTMEEISFKGSSGGPEYMDPLALSLSPGVNRVTVDLWDKEGAQWGSTALWVIPRYNN